MEINLDTKEDVTDYVTVPPGFYICEIADVRPGTTRAGDPRWSMRLVVAEGEFTGRQAAWDALVFSARGRARVRRVFAALGLPSEGVVDVDPADLHGRRALVEIRAGEFTNQEKQSIRRNEVPYDGYRSADDRGQNDGGEDEAADGGASVPF